MLQLKTILDIIDEDNLFNCSSSTGKHIISGLNTISVIFPHIISNVRGEGFIIAFDTPSPQLLLKKMEDNGILASICGKNTIRLRPSLIFNYYDSGVFLDKLELAIFDMNNHLLVYE